MASNIEIKRMRVEILRIQGSKAELELKIDERMEEIERVREHIRLQEIKIAELEAKLAEALG